ncbi:recombinase family protein [Jeotgalibaca sp. MA1X17-3]|uniref:recombinase family protein n=1 Tax=Jeotgalibaca sp. MA1X17-3 TaxID=2908211 RepID=UPI001F18DBE3|nr:recombinase family protein [Jeotgalibaca sp. MA1X17-3]UJF15955.1 recombinase family protein [Jeotgalibaca sp. MA1X17-3]
MTNKAVIYARQSTSMQQSIPAQVTALNDFAYEKQMQVEVVFKDIMSGKNTNREGFNAMKKYLKENNIAYLLVWRYDRLARNLKDLHAFLAFCLDMHVKVISISEQYVDHKSGKAKDILLLQLVGSIAEYQRTAIQENQQIAYQHMHAQGKIVSANVPYGYRLVEGELVLEPTETSIVKQIFSQYSQGLGYKRIAENLNQSALLNRNGKLWQTARIKAILDNTFYIGKITSKYGNSNVHNLPIISNELFDKVHQIKISKSPVKQRVTRRYVLQGKILCPHCHLVCTPTHTLNNNKDYYYYSCPLYAANGKRHCPGCHLDALKIEQAVCNILTSFLQSDVIRKQLNTQITQTNSEILKKNNKKKTTLKQRQKKLLLDFENKKIDSVQLSQKLAALNTREQTLELAPLIPKEIGKLVNLNITVDPNPTITQYMLYQGILDSINVSSEKLVTAVRLKGLDQNIMEGKTNVS